MDRNEIQMVIEGLAAGRGMINEAAKQTKSNEITFCFALSDGTYYKTFIQMKRFLIWRWVYFCNRW